MEIETNKKPDSKDCFLSKALAYPAEQRMGNTLSDKISSIIGQAIAFKFQRPSRKINNPDDSSDENVSPNYRGQ